MKLIPRRVKILFLRFSQNDVLVKLSVSHSEIASPTSTTAPRVRSATHYRFLIREGEEQKTKQQKTKRKEKKTTQQSQSSTNENTFCDHVTAPAAFKVFRQ